MKVKLMGKDVELIKESENEIKRVGGRKMDKYQVLLILLLVTHRLFLFC